jgi:hypothetical protein
MNKLVHAAITSVVFKFILSLFFALPFSYSFAQVKFSAAASSKTVGKNDYLQIQFTIENASNVEGVAPPAFKNFTIISGPNQQSSITNINGNIKHSISIGYILKPISTGTFTIASAVAKVDGKEYRSNALKVEVNSSVASNKSSANSASSPYGSITLDFPSEPATHQFDDYILRKGENVAEKIKKNLFVKIDVNKTSCYVGEPVVATYKLFTRLKSESNVLKTPSFNGFSVSELEMPDNYSVSTERSGGREYNVYTLRKVQLYPLQSGTLTLEPVEVKNSVTFLKAEYAGRRNGDIFYDMLRNFADETAPGNATEQQIVTVSCQPLNITVKPLPEANKPSDFKGAVGNFKISSNLEKNSITTDDAGALRVVISGTGNLQMINAPTVLWTKGFEGFESKSTEQIDNFSVPMKGEKVFLYPFTVASAGDYTVPAINFSYFDISTQSYKTISTQPISLHVEKGTGAHPKFLNTNNPNKGNGNTVTDFLPENILYFICGGVALLAFAVVASRRNSKSNTKAVSKKIDKNVYQPDPVEEPSFVIPANPLAEAEEKLAEGSNEFYKVLDVSLDKYFSEKLNIPVEELTKKKINERMDKCNVSVGTTLLVNSLLEDIELNLYAPISSTTQMNEVYEKASEVVSLLDKQIC